MSILTANPASEDPGRHDARGMNSAMDAVRAADRAADRIYARLTVTDSDWTAITNYLKAAS